MLSNLKTYLPQTTKGRIFLSSALIITFLITIVATVSYQTYKRVVVVANVPAATSAPVVPTPTPDPLAPINILLLGYGGGTHEGGRLTDTMILAQVQPRSEQVMLLSLPRDIWVPLPIIEGQDPVSHKLNAAYALGSDDRSYPHKPIQYTGPAGGGELAKFAVEYVTGVPVHHFAAVSFAGFEDAIDELGGITVNVPYTFTDEFYPVAGLENEPCDKSEEEIAALTATMSGYKLEQEFKCRYETLDFTAGSQVLDGETALKFVRSRHSETVGGDFQRSQRQQALLNGVQNRVLALNFIPKAFPFLHTISRDFQTDITAKRMQEIIGKFSELEEVSISSAALSDTNVLTTGRSAGGQYILVPKEDWQAVHAFVQDELNSD